MRRLFLPCLFPLLLSAVAVAAHAESIAVNLQDECQTRLPSSRIVVMATEAPVQEMNNESLRELTADSAAQNGPGAANQYTLGLTRTTLQLQVRYQLTLLSVPGVSQACARPALSVSITQPYHRVDIAREFAPGSCLYQAIRQHEYRHVRVNQENLRRAKAVIAREMKDYYGNRVFYGTRDEIIQQLDQAVKRYWIPRVQQLHETSQMRQQQIDSPEEYGRMGTICNGELARVLRASHQGG
jgi:hypothetical protein